MLQGIADGMRNPEAALAPELETLEAAERERFAALGGREVDTGRLERSLTESGGPDAIREVTSSELVFGTRVPYAQYQTDEDGNNLVMVRPGDAGQAGIAQRVLDRVVNG